MRSSRRMSAQSSMTPRSALPRLVRVASKVFFMVAADGSSSASGPPVDAKHWISHAFIVYSVCCSAAPAQCEAAA